MEVYKATILAFSGNWMSGIATLLLEDSEGSGGASEIFCENAQTVRCLEGAFGNVIGEGHTVNNDGGFVGKEIYYSMDPMDLLLECFTPVEDASPELIDYYNKERNVFAKSSIEIICIECGCAFYTFKGDTRNMCENCLHPIG